MAIKRSVDVIRAAAAEQKGFADQVIDPPKIRARFLENAADLNRAADRMENTEKALGLFIDFMASLPKGWLGKTCADVGLLNAAYLAATAAGFAPKPKAS